MKAFITYGEYWPTLAATRSLGKRGIDVTVGASMAKSVSFHTKYCKERIVYTNPKKIGVKVADIMLSIVKKKKFDVFFPVEELMLLGVTKNIEEFEKYTRLMVPDYETAMVAADKGKMCEVARRKGIRIPKTFLMEDLSKFGRAVKEMEFPVIVKPCIGTGSSGQSVFKSAEGLEEAFRKTVSVYGPSMIQEYVKGSKYALSAVLDERGRPIRACAQRTIAQFPLSGGPQVVAETVGDEKIVDFGLGLLEKIGWQGMAQVEMLLEEKTGKPVLIEINPRFYGSMCLAIEAGADFPWVLWQMALGEKVVPNINYKVGVRARLLIPDETRRLIYILSGASDSKKKGLNVPGKVQALKEFTAFRGRKVHDYFLSLSDMGPAAFVIANTVAGPIERRVGNVFS